MLTGGSRWMMAAIWMAYVGIAELLGLGQTSKVSQCLLISEEQEFAVDASYQACAPLHEMVFRLGRFFWNHAGHDNVVALGTVVIAVFTLTLWWSTRRMWQATEAH